MQVPPGLVSDHEIPERLGEIEFDGVAISAIAVLPSNLSGRRRQAVPRRVAGACKGSPGVSHPSVSRNPTTSTIGVPCPSLYQFIESRSLEPNPRSVLLHPSGWRSDSRGRSQTRTAARSASVVPRRCRTCVCKEKCTGSVAADRLGQEFLLRLGKRSPKRVHATRERHASRLWGEIQIRGWRCSAFCGRFLAARSCRRGGMVGRTAATRKSAVTPAYHQRLRKSE